MCGRRGKENLLLKQNKSLGGELQTVAPEMRFDRLGKIIHALALATKDFCLLIPPQLYNRVKKVPISREY
jgi:hypothetical protein